MTVVEDIHAEHGATFGERDGRRIVRHYGQPETTVNTIRNGVGVTEMEYGAVTVSGEDRVGYVDNVVSNVRWFPILFSSSCFFFRFQ